MKANYIRLMGVAAAAFFTGAASAAEFTWTGGGSGWADGANWGNGVLELESGLAHAASLTVDGVAKGGGFYGAAACADPRVPTANRLSCMAGGGVLRVGKNGAMMTIR